MTELLHAWTGVRWLLYRLWRILQHASGREHR